MLLNRNRRFPRIPFAAAFASSCRSRLRLRPRIGPAPAPLSLAFLLAAAVLLAGMLAGPTPPAAAHDPDSDSDPAGTVINSISITSNAGADREYVTGDTITVRIGFASGFSIGWHENVQLKIQVGRHERTVTIPNAGSFGSPLTLTSMDFTYTVTAEDNDQDGITVATNALSGTLRHFHGTGSYHTTNTTLPNTRATAQSNHRVNVGTDHDDDDDNLIEVTTLAQLDAIRYDLNGNGAQDAVNATDWARHQAAFNDAIPNMGCPNTCLGYELEADLDFDTDSDGSTHTAGMGDMDDTYYDDGAGWTPIGGADEAAAQPFSATLEGNGHTISNLFIKRTGNAAAANTYVGLFADLSGTVRNLNLVNPYVENTRNASGAFTWVRTGALAGRANGATVSGVAVAGGSVRGVQNIATGEVTNLVGCLLGYSAATVSSSRASCNATATGSHNANDWAGGLIGYTYRGAVSHSYATGTVTADSVAGGLIGDISGTAVTYSSARGAVSATGFLGNTRVGGLAGGLAGRVTGAGTTVSYSYATGAVSASGANASVGGLVGKIGPAALRASYATGAATATGGNVKVGGLVGEALNGTDIRAAYAAGAATARGAGARNIAGGLIGELTGASSFLTASYARGAVSAAGGAVNSAGGLLGRTSRPTWTEDVTNSHWDREATGQASSSLPGEARHTVTARTTAALQIPTDYGAIEGTYALGYAGRSAFYGWNIDVDGVSGSDDPWHFGTSADYPILKFGHDALSLAWQMDQARDRAAVDYDADNDNLIEISKLAQLDAIRYDLDGNGAGVALADALKYALAFPGLRLGMGCPAACAGYELAADLDFDTDGDGATYTVTGGTATVDAEDTGNFFNGAEGWAPIGDAATPYTAVFEGNRHTIANLYINIPSSSSNTRERLGLFGELASGGAIRRLGLFNAYVSQTRSQPFYAGTLLGANNGTVMASYATGTLSATCTHASMNAMAGGLVGRNNAGSAIRASYARVAVTLTGWEAQAGGLVGYNHGGAITASYAAGAVAGNGTFARAGGLVGTSENNTDVTPNAPATIAASYARGAVSGSGSGAVQAGLVAAGVSTVTNSYWDTDTSGQSASAGGGAGQTTNNLQTPTAYGTTGIYTAWNVDVDGESGNDDPWHFGTASQYPILKYSGFSPAAQGRSGGGTDYDTDDDGLIDIGSLARLDAVRYDLDGDGRPARILDYLAAFPGAEVGSDAVVGTAGRMGCAYDHDGDPDTAMVRACRGYELTADLDFDTDSSGATHTNGVGDADDDYYNDGAGWAPIGRHDSPYTAEFNGRGNVIANLYLNREQDYNGLFAALGSAGKIIAVGLSNPRVQNGQDNVGALVGHSAGLVAASYTRDGSVAARRNVGGLVGANAAAGRIVASYATTDVACTGSKTGDSGAGLVSATGGGVTASYARGAVTGNCANKAGLTQGSAGVTASYWEKRTPNPVSGNPGGAEKTTAQLQSPLCYTGDFAGWNVDVDGDGAADQPWYFGGGSDYPALQYGDPAWVTDQGIGSRLAELTGLAIAPGQIYNDFRHCPSEYQAATGPAVTQLSVTHTAASGVTPTYQDADDATLSDADSGTDGLQTALDAGENTVKVTVSAGRSYVLKVNRAAADAVETAGATLTLDDWAGARNGRLATTPAQLSGSTRAAQALTFRVATLFGQTPTGIGYWDTLQVWLCTTRTVDNARPTVADGCVNAGIMYNPTPDDLSDDNTAQVLAPVTRAQALNGGVVVKVWDTGDPGDPDAGEPPEAAALQLAQWLPIRLNDDAALRKLSIAAGGVMTPDFAPATHRYTYYPASGATQITVTPTTNNPAATVAYQNSGGNALTDADGNADGFQIPVGSAPGAVTEFAVVVTAPDGTTAQRYTVTVSAAPGLAINPSPLAVTEGGASSYTVALTNQPSAGVTVNISRQSGGAEQAQIRVGGAGNFGTTASLAFTTGNWDTPQTVSVSTATDGDANDETDTFAHTVATGGAAEYLAATANLSVNIQEPGYTFDPTSLSMNEGGNATYTVKLDTPPSAAVTVTVGRSSGLGEVQFSSSASGTYANTLALNFTTGNWDTVQTVYVKAGQDDDAANDTGNITHSGAGNGSGYHSITANLATTVTDNDTPALLISPSSLTMGEGTDATYTVRLATEPSQGVTVAITPTPASSTDVTFDTDGDSTFSTSETLSFGASADTNAGVVAWNDPQTVTVRAAVDTDTPEADDTAWLTHAITSSDSGYSGLSNQTLRVNVQEPGYTFAPTSLTILENGNASYTVKLDTKPAAGVSLAVSGGSGLSDLTFSATEGSGYAGTLTLSFTTTNWSAAQRVYVRAANDSDGDNDIGNITHTGSNAGSVASGYAGYAGNLATTINDNDPRGVRIIPSPLTLIEGTDATYTVNLTTAPSAAVRVTITRNTAAGSMDVTFDTDGDGTFSTSETLDFTTINWFTAQSVTVRAAADADSQPDRAGLIHTMSSSDPGYAGLSDASSGVVNVQEPGYTFDPTSLTVLEGADTSYTVKLATPPAANVSVAVSSGSGLSDLTFSTTEGSGYASTLTLSFTTGDWNTAQTVYVRAATDPDGDNDTGNISHAASGSNSGYANFTGNLAATVTDNDTPGLVIAPSSLTMGEGTDANYTVRLITQPSANVTVTIARGTGGSTDVTFDTGDGTFAASGETLTFGASADANAGVAAWNDPQTVTVRAAVDTDTPEADDTATLEHTTTTTDSSYQSISANLTVTVQERNIILNPATALSLVEEGAAVSYTVALSRQPSDTVTVAVASAGSDLEFSRSQDQGYSEAPMLSPALSFTTGNWNTPQTVYVQAGQDEDGQDDTPTITHTPSGGGYAVVHSRAVTVVDNDVRLIHTATNNALTVAEGGSGTFTVRLGSPPTGAVTVAIARAAGSNADITPNPASLTFDATASAGVALWSDAQTVTVSAATDSNSDNDTASLTFSLTSNDDNNYGTLSVTPIEVTVTDRVSAGLTVNPTALSITRGNSGTYTIVLTARPSAEVRVTPTAEPENSGLTFTATPPLPLTFNGDNWDTPQTVTVAAAANAAATATITHTLAGGDANYTALDVSGDNVAVTTTAPAATGGGGFGGGGGGGGNTFGGGAAAAAPAASPPDIEFSADSVAVDEGGAAAYRVRLSAEPTGAATVTITSSSSDVTATPASLDFADAWDQWQTVLVTAARDRNNRDESVRLTHRGPEGSRGVLPVSVADTWPEAVTRTVNGNTLTVTYTQDAPPGVTVAAPETLAADAAVAVSVPPEDTPPTPLAYGLGEGAATPAHISVSGTGTDGLTICLPAVAAATAAAASVAEGDEPPPPTLLRYTGTAADGSWQPVENAQVVADADTGLTTVCAAGVTGEGVYAAAYLLPPLGTIADFTATPGTDPGTVTLNWQAADNATHHFIAGVSRADLDAGRFVFAIWNWSEEPDSHTYTDLDSGVLYYITAIAGRYFEARDQTQWSAWVNWQLVTPN